MKRNFALILIVIFIVFISSGCSSNWKSKVRVSSLSFEDNHIIGKIKNLTNEAYDLTITIEAKSGSLKEKEYCYITLKPEETKDLECLATKLNESYSLKVDNIDLEKIEIPELKEGNIDIETLKYYFEEIYDKHGYNFASFSTKFKDGYPYIDRISYSENEIEIHGIIATEDKKAIMYYERFNPQNSDFLRMIVLVPKNDEKLINDVALSLMSLSLVSNESSYSIYEALKKDDIPTGLCYRVGKLCIANYSYDDNFKAFDIEME